MRQLMRRVAMGLTLPLVVGAPVVLLAGPAHAADLTLTSITVQNSAVYGQEVHASAKVTDQELTAVSAGSVQFGYRPPGSNPSDDPIAIGAAVPLAADGTAVSPILATNDGTPFEVTPGSDQFLITARYLPNVEDWGSSRGEHPISIFRSGTSLAVLPTATTLVADIVGASPGGVQLHSVKPDGGTVQFSVNGAAVGSPVPAVNGSATLAYALPSGTNAVTASYSGDTHYTASSQSSTRKDPILEARLLTTFPKSRSGWYKNAVDIWFICKPQGSELVEECPADTTLSRSGKGQTLTRTVHALDGGSATITLSGIDIDRDKPVITVKGRGCTATDKLSGVKGKCRMKISPNGRFTAVAQDKAGNRAVKRGVLD
jgi:hypothetical protein